MVKMGLLVVFEVLVSDTFASERGTPLLSHHWRGMSLHRRQSS